MAEDAIARQEAALARQEIKSHRSHCAERWDANRKQWETVHGRISETKQAVFDNDKALRELIHGLVRKGLWTWIGGQSAVILLLAGAIVTFVLTK